MTGSPAPGSHGEHLKERSFALPRPVGYPGREILSGRSPRGILGKILKDDALEVRGMCVRLIRAQAVLLDDGRLFLRTAARMAHRAPHYKVERRV